MGHCELEEDVHGRVRQKRLPRVVRDYGKAKADPNLHFGGSTMRIGKERTLILIICLLALLLFGCAPKQKDAGQKRQTNPAVSVAKSSQTPNQNAQNPMADAEPAPELTVIEPQTPIMKELQRYVLMPQSQVFKELGEDYELTDTGAEGVLTGYYYKPIGLTFTFEETGESMFIDCDETVDINGARAGMSIVQVAGILGKVPVKKTWIEIPEFDAYYVTYMIGKCRVEFVSYSGENAEDTLVTVFGF